MTTSVAPCSSGRGHWRDIPANMERLHCMHRENNGSPDGQNHPDKIPVVMTTEQAARSPPSASLLPTKARGAWSEEPTVWRPHRHTYARASGCRQTQLIRSSLGAFSTSGAGPQFSGHTSPPFFDALAAAHNVKTEPFMSLADIHASWEPSLTLGPHRDTSVCASTGLCNFGFKFGKPTTSDPRGHCLGPKGCTSRIYHIETLYLEGCSWSKVDLFHLGNKISCPITKETQNLPTKMGSSGKRYDPLKRNILALLLIFVQKSWDLFWEIQTQ